MAMAENYTYLPIRDAISAVNQKVNLMGAVVEFSSLQKSKGTDCFCTMKIIDESYQSPGLLVTIFAENMEKLPHVKAIGDIIRLTRVMMNAHQGKVNASFHKKYSSFALFEGKPCYNFVPYEAPSNFHLSVLDKNVISCLRTWFPSFQPDSGRSESLMLREIKEGECFDLVGKILHICDVSKMLFVWDGSDAPPLSCQTRLCDEMENPLPLQLESSPLPRDVLRTFPCLGTILRVNFGQVSESFGLHLLQTGIWIKFLNIVCHVRSGLWYGVLEPSSAVQNVPNDDTVVECLQSAYKERSSSTWGHMPFSSFPWPCRITETEHEDASFVTLMRVISCRKVIGKFRCVVRVMAICPWRVEDFRSPGGRHSYRMRLTIEDPTARIHAFICGEDGETFFGGYPSMEELTRKRNKLLGITEGDDGKEDNGPRNPPWVQCCIKSYYTVKADPWGSRHYGIFGTKLLA